MKALTAVAALIIVILGAMNVANRRDINRIALAMAKQNELNRASVRLFETMRAQLVVLEESCQIVAGLVTNPPLGSTGAFMVPGPTLTNDTWWIGATNINREAP